MAIPSAADNAAVRVSVPQLVRLNQAARGLSLRPSQVRAQMSGDYLSRLKGRGMEFAESRPYEPGDDVRNLHWRVMARTGKPFTKQFREERERPVLIWTDLRNRMFFGTRGSYKAVVAAKAAALAAWIATRNGDRVGGIICAEREHQEFKPDRGKAATLKLIRHIAEHPSWDSRPTESGDETDASEAILRLRRVARPGSLIVMLSDFSHFDRAAELNLAQLSRHNEFVLMHIFDPLEAALPPPGSYRLSDGQHERILNTDDAAYRAEYAERFQRHADYIGGIARRYRMTFLSCRTDQDPALVWRTSTATRPRP